MADRKPIWLITGVSSGIGRALADAALKRGDTVIATFRRQDQADSFETESPGRSFACVLDLADNERVRSAITGAIERGGGIDFVVNNAGYGLMGAVEELSDAEARRQMEVNFFGALSVTQAALPYLRHQRRGHIINISSIAGMVGHAGLALYCASKAALEGMGEALALEVRHLGIKVTNIEPGSFRTNWRGKDALLHAQRVIDDYGPSVGAIRAKLAATDGQQEGDPAKAALAIFKIVESPDPPLHLPLNPRAWNMIRNTLETAIAELDAWAAVSHDTTFSSP